MVLVVTAPRLMESRTAAVLRALSTGANFLAVRRWTYARAYRPSGRKMMDVSGIVNWFHITFSVYIDFSRFERWTVIKLGFSEVGLQVLLL